MSEVMVLWFLLGSGSYVGEIELEIAYEAWYWVYDRFCDELSGDDW